MKAINEFLEKSLEHNPSKKAIIFKNDFITYETLYRKTNSFSNFIQDQTKIGDVVSLISGNSLEFLISYLSILKSGCIAHIIPTNISDAKLRYQIRETNPVLIFSNKILKNKLGRTDSLLEAKFVDIKSTEFKIKEKSSFYGNRFCDFSAIMFTSGTSGTPKGVKIKHKNVISVARNIVDKICIQSCDVEVNPLPLSHSFGLGSYHAILLQGATSIIFENSINLKEILLTIIKERASGFVNTPPTFRILLDSFRELFGNCRMFLKYMITNSIKIPKKTVSEVLNLLPSTKFYTYYGLTEASRSTFLLFNENIPKIESVGTTPKEIKIKIVDDEDNGKKVNEEGEILISGPNVIDGYWNPKDNEGKLQNGWLKTGDLGYFDEDNFLFLTGRKDDMINVGGEKVSPLEIENVIKQMDYVSDVAVVGVYDETFGEIPVAYVVTNDSTDRNSDIINHCTKNLEGYKIPRNVFSVESIPKTEAGKIQRFMLKKGILE